MSQETRKEEAGGSGWTSLLEILTTNSLDSRVAEAGMGSQPGEGCRVAGS